MDFRVQKNFFLCQKFLQEKKQIEQEENNGNVR